MCLSQRIKPGRQACADRPVALRWGVALLLLAVANGVPHCAVAGEPLPNDGGTSVAEGEETPGRVYLPNLDEPWQGTDESTDGPMFTDGPRLPANSPSYSAPLQNVSEPQARGQEFGPGDVSVDAQEYWLPGEQSASSSTQVFDVDEILQLDEQPCFPFSSAQAPAVSYDPNVPEEEAPLFAHLSEGFLSALERPIEPLAESFACLLGTEHDQPKTELDGYPIGLQEVPSRPPLVIEWNEEFLAPGFLEQGITLPTGAIWRPSLWVFGTYRTGVNYFENGTGSKVVEWANRLDLFSQVNLSGTERILFGIRPLDKEERTRRVFSGYDFEQGAPIDGLNADVQTLFFEGDFGEIFPRLDPYDRKALDYGFSIGRQPMLFQQGLMVNDDRLDALTITRNTLNGNGNLNLRMTGVYSWEQITRDNLTPGGNTRDNGSQMVGLFTESDFRNNMVNADVAYVWSDDGFGDMFVAALSGIRRFHGYHNTYNSSLHVLASFPTNGETNFAGQGELLFSQLSWTPHHSDDLIYLNSFWAIDQFTSAARGPLMGGPLGQTGLLFSAAGLGRYGAPLSNQANSVVGASLGYQMFFDHKKQQVVYEIGGRQDTNQVNQAAIATGVRYQRALDQHWFVVVDTFVSKQEKRDVGQGVRLELQAKF